MKTLLTTIALVVAMTAGANAAQLGAGPIFSNSAYFGYCWWINLGSANITPTSQDMYLLNSNIAVSTHSTCPNGSPVSPGTSCETFPVNEGVNGLSCKMVFSTSAVNVRGSLELTDANSNELSQVELR